MKSINFDYQHSLIEQHELNEIKAQVEIAHEALHNKTGPGSDYTGWVDYPQNYNHKELERLKKAAKEINSNSEILVVIGIGGSYLGARAIIDIFNHSFYNLLPNHKRKAVSIFYAGNNISGSYLRDLIELLEEKEFSLNVISKSGTTTEPAIAFRILKRILEDKYGIEEARKRIYVTTDSQSGALLILAKNEGYETFSIPDDIVGRYSVLTPVGLLPIAAAGIDIDQLLEGGKSAMEEYNNKNLNENKCYQYAALRNILYRKGKDIEILVNYEPAWRFFAEWWTQLWGE